MPSVADLVHQTSASTGTGNLTVASVNGKRDFGTVFGTGGTPNVFDYYVSNRGAAEWEYGTGHMSDGTTLVRDTVILSSNSNTAVSFTAGTKDVVNDLPAGIQNNLVAHMASTSNPHSVTKSQVGLGNVTNDAQLALAGGTMTGNIGFSSTQTVDGRDVSADGAKLDGIEAAADVTDATNVAAAGAVMDGDFSSDGLMARTAAGVYASRTITGTANQIVVTNGDGDAGNPTIAASIASQGEAEAGSDNTKLMTALRVAQAIAALAGGGGSIIAVQFFTSSTTYNRTSGATKALVLVLGSTGGSGGISRVGSGTAVGGWGGPTNLRIGVCSPAATETVTIGAGGSAGAAGNNAGGSAGNTSFGSHIVCDGGDGGGGGNGNTGTAGTRGTAANSGGVDLSSFGFLSEVGGEGPHYPWFGRGIDTPSSNGNGTSGTDYGFGTVPSGPRNSSNATTAGVAGTTGFILVIEFA